MALPLLTPDADLGVSAPPPPLRFHALAGKPTEVRLLPGRMIEAGFVTGAQKNGLRYEKKVQEYLTEELGHSYRRSPYIHFKDKNGSRTLIPDGLLLTAEGKAVIFEIKSQHMPEAWWQLRQLYEPVVTALGFLNWVHSIEVVRTFDPMIGFPEPVRLFRDVREAIEAPNKPFKVLQWR